MVDIAALFETSSMKQERGVDLHIPDHPFFLDATSHKQTSSWEGKSDATSAPPPVKQKLSTNWLYLEEFQRQNGKYICTNTNSTTTTDIYAG